MSDTSIPGGRIRSFVERIEHLDTELQELNEQKKEVFAEAKGEGFDVKILKEIIKLRKQDEDERDERESLLDLYMRAMETATPEKEAKAAVEEMKTVLATATYVSKKSDEAKTDKDTKPAKDAKPAKDK